MDRQELFAKQYLDLYAAEMDTLYMYCARPFTSLREAAHTQLWHMEEDWLRERYRHTPLRPLLDPDYGLNLRRLPIPADPYAAFRCDVPNLSTSLYFVINDRFSAEHRPAAPLPEGVFVGPMGEGMQREDIAQAVHRHFAKHDMERPVDHHGAPVSPEPLLDPTVALNEMFAQDALVVYLPKDTKVERPLQIVNILRADVDLMVNRRVLVVAAPGSQAHLLFCDHAADNRRFLTTQVVEVVAEAGARLDITCLEETHSQCARLNNVFLHVERDAEVRHHNITLSCGTTRNNITARLAEPGATCYLGGCAIADGRQHIDNHTLIDHAAPHGTSRELYKYVLGGEAEGVFNGRVLVRPDAQQTVSEESNQNLCTTETAKMTAKPVLEIYADDVKCAHGSTVGQLNDAALFYMRQRGISPDTAKLLLENAFLAEVIDQISLEPVRDRLRHLVEKRLRGELAKCEGCKLCK